MDVPSAFVKTVQQMRNININNNKRPLTPKSMPPAGDELKTQNLGPQQRTQKAKKRNTV